MCSKSLQIFRERIKGGEGMLHLSSLHTKVSDAVGTEKVLSEVPIHIYWLR